MTRSVGVEVEFIGVEFAEASRIVAERLAATATIVSEHEHEFDTDEGTYRLEVDFELLKTLSREREASDEDDRLGDLAVGALSLAAKVATPLELVTPPLRRAQLPDVDTLLAALAEAGAQGTGESILYAFGVHFNPQARLDTSSIRAHLRAFLCLHDYLADRDETDLTRVVTAFALPFPEAYERVALAADYAPARPRLIDDYLHYNATRNRALDMLPLFAHLDEKRVRDKVDDERINARPTYHYRLPNSRVGDEDWSLMDPWQGWLEVERLAHDADRLEALCAERLDWLERGMIKRRRADWIAQCQRSVDAR